MKVKHKQRLFDTRNVILTQIDEDDLMSFLIDFDINDDGTPKYLIEEFCEAVFNTIPEYAFAKHIEINSQNALLHLREAAKQLYKIKEIQLHNKAIIENDKAAKRELENSPYLKRGEFGELILHLLLREFKNTIPLVSKLYFKDSNGVPAHGFDSVHISESDNILWLGESKLFHDSKGGIRALIQDIKEHFTHNYLNDQFLLIDKYLHSNSIPQRKKWLEILSSTNKLIDRIKIINIPVLCTYSDSIYEKITIINDEIKIQHETSARELKRYFNEKNNHPQKEELNIILLLFPVKSKKDLVYKLHEKLFMMQRFL